MKITFSKLKKSNQFLKYKNFFDSVKQTSSNSSNLLFKIAVSKQTNHESELIQTEKLEESNKINLKLLIKLEDNIQIFEQ